jgi:hypothetical protein
MSPCNKSTRCHSVEDNVKNHISEKPESILIYIYILLITLPSILHKVGRLTMGDEIPYRNKVTFNEKVVNVLNRRTYYIVSIICRTASVV